MYIGRAQALIGNGMIVRMVFLKNDFDIAFGFK
jgi:hypothetical protein